MISDASTFTLAFAAVFLALAVYLFKMDRDAKRLEFRIEILEQVHGDDASPKNEEE